MPWLRRAFKSWYWLFITIKSGVHWWYIIIAELSERGPTFLFRPVPGWREGGVAWCQHAISPFHREVFCMYLFIHSLHKEQKRIVIHTSVHLQLATARVSMYNLYNITVYVFVCSSVWSFSCKYVCSNAFIAPISGWFSYIITFGYNILCTGWILLFEINFRYYCEVH